MGMLKGGGFDGRFVVLVPFPWVLLVLLRGDIMEALLWLRIAQLPRCAIALGVLRYSGL